MPEDNRSLIAKISEIIKTLREWKDFVSAQQVVGYDSKKEAIRREKAGEIKDREKDHNWLIAETLDKTEEKIGKLHTEAQKMIKDNESLSKSLNSILWTNKNYIFPVQRIGSPTLRDRIKEVIEKLKNLEKTL